jgi:anti-anti-sigma factor
MTTPADRLPFRLHSDRAGVHLIVRLEGELDFSCIEFLRAGLLPETPAIACVTLDLGDLEFVDVAGARGILNLWAAHARLGRVVRVIHVRPLAARIFALLGTRFPPQRLTSRRPRRSARPTRVPS